METQLSARERETLARRAIRVQQALAEADPSNVQAVADFGDTQWALGLALFDQQRDREASVAVATSVRVFERALAVNPDYQDGRRGLGYARTLLGKLAMRRNDPRAALDQYDKARALLEAPDVAHVSGDDLADLYNSIGDASAALSPDRCDADSRRTSAAWYRKSDSAWTAIASRRPLDASEARVQREVAHKLAGDSEACY